MRELERRPLPDPDPGGIRDRIVPSVAGQARGTPPVVIAFEVQTDEEALADAVPVPLST